VAKPAANPAELIDRDGYTVVSGMLSETAVQHLRGVVAEGGTHLTRGRSAYGGRNLLGVPDVRNLAAEQSIRTLIEPIVGKAATPVRALFFDKTPEANWPVLWHQDLTIAVAERHDHEGWGPWSIKAGVTHVEPPAALLATMLTVRLHLDDCHTGNGPLRVLPGSHRLGRLTRDRIRALTATGDEVACLAPAGAALIMRPLLLHASSPATRPDHRRVIHIEYARADALPHPLRWAYAEGAAGGAPPREGSS
jgi:ectoine hydroxylase-related dioxygenase (phytanoyl-CoA dioxygenase family)